MAAYAYVCQGCLHLSSNHTLVEGGDLRAGPYRCAHCDCEISQESATLPLWTVRDYEAYDSRPETPRNIWLDRIP